MGPFSLGIWDEPGLLIEGHDHPPMVMMGHNTPNIRAGSRARAMPGVKDLYTYDVPTDRPFPPLVERIVASGEKNARIRIRKVDKSRFDEEAALILSILNEAWSDNWGFIPLTDSEIAYAGKKLKPIVIEDMILIAEYDAEEDRSSPSLHDGPARHQRVHHGPEGRALPVRLRQIALAAEEDAARRAGGCR